MKIPGTFLPEISLDGKIVDLLEKTMPNPDYDIDKDAEELFPKFVGYLKGKYENLRIFRRDMRYHHCWKITTNNSDKKKVLGTIKSYSVALSEYGYEVNVKIDGKARFLLYATGYGYSPAEKEHVIKQNPRRYDYEEDIPFP